jgi:hypothetical protein
MSELLQIFRLASPLAPRAFIEVICFAVAMQTFPLPPASIKLVLLSILVALPYPFR